MPCAVNLLTSEEPEVRLRSRIARVPGRMRRQRPTPDHTEILGHHKNMTCLRSTLLTYVNRPTDHYLKTITKRSNDILVSLKSVMARVELTLLILTKIN